MPFNIHCAIAEFSRARCISSGVRSKPVTRAPARAAVIATTPVPQATSSTRWPARIPACFTNCAAGPVVIASSGAKYAQPCFCAALNASKGSMILSSIGIWCASISGPTASTINGAAIFARIPKSCESGGLHSRPSWFAISVPPVRGYTQPHMPVLICMLRGVNVGGHNKIKMESFTRALRISRPARCRTYIQSGNIVFRAKQKILRSWATICRTPSGGTLDFALKSSCARPPSLGMPSQETLSLAGATLSQTSCFVAFLASDPAQRFAKRYCRSRSAPEELHIDRREIYIYFPNGMARPKLSLPVLDRTLKISEHRPELEHRPQTP